MTEQHRHTVGLSAKLGDDSTIAPSTVNDQRESNIHSQIVDRMRASIDGDAEATMREGGEDGNAQRLINNLDFEKAKDLLSVLEVLEANDRDTCTISNISSSAQSIVDGRYQILEKVGEGGFGVVLRAFDSHLDRTVALKFSRLESVFSRGYVLREARLAARLDHPSIVKVYDVGQIGPLWYIASAFYEGPTLASWLHQRDTPLPPLVGARLLSQLAEAVDYAHKNGVIHRDLKPSNVLLVMTNDPSTPRLLLTDFGLASHAVDADQDWKKVRGTFAYMAPELLASSPLTSAVATDIYSLGAVLYELLAGVLPVEVTEEASLASIRTSKGQPIVPVRERRPDVPADLDAICQKCLSHLPSDRYETAMELAHDLGRFCRHEPVTARPLGTIQILTKAARRHRWIAMLLLALLGSILVGSLTVTWLYHGERIQRQLADSKRMTARQAVDDIYGVFSERWLANERGMEPALNEFIEKALAFYEQEAVEQPTDEKSLWGLQVALHRSANCLSWLGRTAETIDRRRRCLKVIESLLQSSPTNFDYRFAKFHNLQLLSSELGGGEEALHLADQSYSLINELAAEHPDDFDVQEALVSTCLAVGRLNNAVHPDRAGRLFREAERLANQLESRFDDNETALQTCAEAYVRLAEGLGAKIRPERRLAAIEKAIRIYVKLLSRPPRKPIHVLMAGVSRAAQAAVLEELGKVSEAELALRKAIELQVGIAEDFPNYPGYVAKVADYQYALGSLLWSQGRHIEARECFIVAQGILVRVLEQWPDLATARDTLAQYVRDCPDESIRNTDRTSPLESPSGI